MLTLFLRRSWNLALLSSLPLASLVILLPARSQVAADGSLSTQVTRSGSNFTIDQGDRVGNNLFHSFSQFSVPTGGTAVFNHAAAVQNIFARVTGSSISNIDGLIQTGGRANLFLLNPAGIQFGANARLNLGGSFIGSTANGVKFSDGFEFNAINQPEPLLTVSIPTGLQFGGNPGAIEMQGSGHLLTAADPTFAPYIQTGLHPGLAVTAGNTLALVGGSIDLQGGVVTAPGGRVELGSVGPGLVSLTTVPQGFQLGYGGVQRFGDIQLRERSLADASGAGFGAIQVQGRQISLEGGSLLWIQNRGLQPSGDLSVVATEALTLSGTSDRLLRSSVVAETVAPGASGDLLISTPRLLLQAGGGIGNKTFSEAASGNITIQSSQIEITGFASRNPVVFSAISSLTVGGTGRSGDVSVTTQQLSLLGSGFLGAATVGRGEGGNLTIKADRVVVSGISPAFLSSDIASASLGPGNAGNLSLTTRTLSVTDSAVLDASSLGTGQAGNVFVQASESIEIRGRVSDQAYPSTIRSIATQPNRGLVQAGIKITTGGTSGNVVINTPYLKVSDRAVLGVSNEQSGRAGTLQVNAGSILLDTGGSIQARTFSGEGGNIVINTRDLLLLRRGSNITATAGGTGNGGNITIDSPIIAGFENSDIGANASQGRGGNIQITTQGIFGLQFRPQITPNNDITARSEFGVNGTVQVNTIGVDPNSGLVELPVNLTDPSQLIADSCAGANRNQFVITGRGGVPQIPTQGVKLDRPWADLRDPTVFRAPSAPLGNSVPQPPITEATTWQRNPEGGIELIADRLAQIPQSATCARSALH